MAYLKLRPPPKRKPANAAKTHSMQPSTAPAHTNGTQPSKTIPPPPPKQPPHSPTKIIHSGSSTSVAGGKSPHSPGKAAGPASPVQAKPHPSSGKAAKPVSPAHPSSPAGKAQAATPASPTHPAKPAASTHPVYARTQGFISKSIFLQVEGESNHDTLTTESRHGKAAFTHDNVKTVKAVFHKHAKSGGGFWEIGPYTSTTTDVRITHKTDLGSSTFEANIAAAIKKGQFPKK